MIHIGPCCQDSCRFRPAAKRQEPRCKRNLEYGDCNYKLHYITAITLLLVCCVLILIPQHTRAAGWNGTLRGGGEVTVDPDTNRATVRKGGVETQLWDGIHRLEDGSRLEVRSGQVVPNKEILRARRIPSLPKVKEVWEGAPITGSSPCEQLVRDVCGADQSCADHDACDPARQLLQMEQEEREASADPEVMTYTSTKCYEVRHDKILFPACKTVAAASAGSTQATGDGAFPNAAPPSNCRLLVNKVCGGDDACAGETACDAAKQLLLISQQDQAAAAAAVPQTGPTDFQCREALLDIKFFKRCNR